MKLFAAFGSTGEIRFIGDVDRGAACDCVCPVCAGPLIAKQGAKVDWHFAHASGLERVECLPGAQNMLRRVAAEYLQQQSVYQLPIYQHRAVKWSKTAAIHEDVSWGASINDDGRLWNTQRLRTLPFLTGTLSSGARFDAHVLVDVDVDRPNLPPPPDREVAKLVFWVRPPDAHSMRSRERLEAHIKATGVWLWRYHPDTKGLVAQAELIALSRAQAADAQIQMMHATMQARLDERRRERLEQEAQNNAEWKRQKHLQANEPDNSVAWAPNRKPYSSFLFYGLKDCQGSWVIYTQMDGSYCMVPAPPGFDGWEEAIPPSIGTFDGGPGYKLSDFLTAIAFLAPRARAIRTTSNAAEIEAWSEDSFWME